MKKPMRSRILSLALISAVAASAAHAGSVNIPARKDNTLYQAANGGISNGAGDFLFTGKTASGVIHRALLSFDVAGSVPAGAIITDATLYLTVSRFAGGAHPISLHALFKDWGEGTSNASGNEGRGTTASVNDATWTKSFNGSPGVLWNTPGGDFFTASDSDLQFGGAFGIMSFNTQEMLDRARAWQSDPGSNLGWIVIGDEAFNSTSVRFNSRTNPDTTSRPRLKLNYRCPADRDNNGTVDLFDYLDFVQAFSDGVSSADFNNDQLIDFFDYLDYLQAFARGC